MYFAHHRRYRRLVPWPKTVVVVAKPISLFYWLITGLFFVLLLHFKAKFTMLFVDHVASMSWKAVGISLGLQFTFDKLQYRHFSMLILCLMLLYQILLYLIFFKVVMYKRRENHTKQEWRKSHRWLERRYTRQWQGGQADTTGWKVGSAAREITRGSSGE